MMFVSYSDIASDNALIYAEKYMENHDLQKEVRKITITHWIVTAIAACLTAAIAIVCIYYAFYIDARKRGYSFRVDGLEFALVMTAFMSIADFVLFFEIYTLNIYDSRIIKIIKFVLHIAGCLAAFVICAVLAIIAASDSERMAREMNIWQIGLVLMPSLGEVLTLLIFFWNTKLMRGPKSCVDYSDRYAHQIHRAVVFEKFLVGFPLVSYAVGYLLGAGLAQLGKSVHYFFCGWMIVIICVAALALSIWIYKRFTNKCYAQKRSSIRHGSTSTLKSEGEKDDRSPDSNYEKGRRLLSSELSAYRGDVKFLPLSWECEPSVKSVDWVDALQLVNKNSFQNGKLIMRGTICCTIMKECGNYDSAKNDVLEKVKENIRNKAEELIDDLRDKYNSYDNVYPEVDCDQIKVTYKTV